MVDDRGACYFTTENNNCPSGSVLSASQRNANIEAWASQITAAGLPWLYWQVIPNADPHVSVSTLLWMFKVDSATVGPGFRSRAGQ